MAQIVVTLKKKVTFKHDVSNVIRNVLTTIDAKKKKKRFQYEASIVMKKS